MAKSFSIDHILYGGGGVNRADERLFEIQQQQQQQPMLLPWPACNGQPATAYPAATIGWAAIPSSRPVGADWFIHQPDFTTMASLWGTTAGSLHPHQWITPGAAWTAATTATTAVDGLYQQGRKTHFIADGPLVGISWAGKCLANWGGQSSRMLATMFISFFLQLRAVPPVMDAGTFYLTGPVSSSVRHQPVSTRKGGQIRFTHRQSQLLEETFETTRYLTPSQRRALANRLTLTERQV